MPLPPGAVAGFRGDRPRLPPGLLARPHLVERLSEGTTRRLTLITAPAGSGKTTLLAQWAEHSPRRFIWLGLADSRSSLEPYLTSLLEALRPTFPEVGRRTLRMLDDRAPSPAKLAFALSSELETTPDPAVLILDNYEHVRDPAAHEFTGALIRDLPPSLHLVLSTRLDPPLPLARWRAADQVLDVRSSDLYFTPQESLAFLRSCLHDRLPARLLEAVVDQSGGWPAGLRLAALTLSGSSAVDSQGVRFGRSRLVMDYFLEEVLAQAGPEVVRLLLRSSILDNLSAPLVSVVTKIPLPTANEVLDYLERNGLFVVGLDGRDGWYRVHPMLRDTLLSKLETSESSETVASLHRRASTWFTTNGVFEEAIRHVVLSGDVDAACQLAEKEALDALEVEDLQRMQRCLALLPEDAVRKRPMLLVIQARLAGGRYGWQAALPLLEEAQKVLERPDGPLTADQRRLAGGLLDTVFAPADFFRGDVQGSLAHAERALEALRGRLGFGPAWATVFVGVSHYVLGRNDMAQSILSRAMEDSEAAGSTFGTSFALLGYSLVHLLAARLTESGHAASSMLALETSAGREFGVAWASYLMGVIAYETNRLTEAADHFDRVLAIRQSASALTLRDSLLGAAIARQAMGRFAEATGFLDEAHQYILRTDDVGFLPFLNSFRARLALMQGDDETARTWLDVTPSRLPPGPMLFLEVPPLTAAKALLVDNHPGRAEAALSALDAVWARCQQEHNTRHSISVVALQAVAMSRLGRHKAAVDQLARALEAGAPGGFVRTFVDIGPPLLRLLQDPSLRSSRSGYVDRLLAAFAAAGAPVAGQGPEPLREPLTPREHDVLSLLQRRLTNDEIARALGISVLTVKRHTGNLYGKLQAADRREAVRRAIAFGLLSPDGAIPGSRDRPS